MKFCEPKDGTTFHPPRIPQSVGGMVIRTADAAANARAELLALGWREYRKTSKPDVEPWQTVRLAGYVADGDEYATESWTVIDRTADDLAAEVTAQIERHAVQLRAQVVASASPYEASSWPIKREEARAYQASSDPADAPLLEAEATARGVPLSDLAQKVLNNAAAYQDAEAAIAGTSGYHRDQVEALRVDGDAPGIATYDWSTGWPEV